MRRMLEPLLCPLPLAGLLTILTVGYALRFATPEQQPLALALLGAFLLLFLALQLLPEHWRRSRDLVLVAMAPVILALGGLSYRVNASQVLLVIWVACMFLAWPARTCLAAAAVANIAFCIALRRAGFQEPEPMVLINMGFQALAAICVHYATSAERSRDALARVNADLLATRALLADSARDAERLRMARELHDVAGHKLTAMRLNLRSLLADPQLAGRHELAVAERLSGELMADIRQVVQSLRDDRGLDLATALRALAAPFPRPRLELEIDPGVRVADPAVAETLLRVVQETLTNAARHSGAGTVRVRLQREDGGLAIDIHDDGQCRGPVREGNGLSGMRERLAALGGRLDVGLTPGGSLRLQARLPA
ncbi:sensor histidine kinase [Pseudoxanthomonas sp. GW2]|uniref:sensor histidine kinase n=1 Tax=Pseudoxanthomonas sp. GW2 TaxID=1211114 RepID=UPI0002D91687|nr:histidine kinase [Pseudoxanthomonas sp. GW2]